MAVPEKKLGDGQMRLRLHGDIIKHGPSVNQNHLVSTAEQQPVDETWGKSVKKLQVFLKCHKNSYNLKSWEFPEDWFFFSFMLTLHKSVVSTRVVFLFLTDTKTRPNVMWRMSQQQMSHQETSPLLQWSHQETEAIQSVQLKYCTAEMLCHIFHSVYTILICL